ncbi:hypothetical protein [Paenibacillus sp. Cedars]|uniref:hypothetical protein n=1 Tax=Paenibacillus sp. Cedars TaxID=1980674 RepID=UPI001163F7DE|nr:hypothetical protein [Paenibacillus sp. Cedars]AWP25344.1 hypothetical protein B9D94_01205 [Paenibacillus sp. Cedars]
MDFKSLLDWGSEQGGYLILFAGIIFVLILAFRRHFIGAIGTFVILIIGYAVVKNPTILGNISEFFTEKIGLKK